MSNRKVNLIPVESMPVSDDAPRYALFVNGIRINHTNPVREAQFTSAQTAIEFYLCNMADINDHDVRVKPIYYPVPKAFR